MSLVVIVYVGCAASLYFMRVVHDSDSDSNVLMVAGRNVKHWRCDVYVETVC